MRFQPSLALPFASILFVLSLCACSKEGQPGAAAGPPSDPAPAAGAASGPGGARASELDFAPGGPIPDERLGDYHVVLHCAIDGKDVGAMPVELWASRAPITVRNFLRLCSEGFYDGLSFHRIVREVMVQTGDPLGTGRGESPHGKIPAEFSDDPERSHAYGVLSMARLGGDPDSASSQFFICCEEGLGTWSLDGKYASFGRITGGVTTLEALADVPTRDNGKGEVSLPERRAVVARAVVHEGAPPRGETIARPEPEPELDGEPRTVLVQHVLIAFRGVPQVEATRSRAEAEALAREVLNRARSGEDFSALVREHSDDHARPGEELPGAYRLNNVNVRHRAAERRFFDLAQRLQKEMEALIEEHRAGGLDEDELEERRAALSEELRKAQQLVGIARRDMVPGFGDLAFSLEVGAIGLLAHDPKASPYGWHVIRRIE